MNHEYAITGTFKHRNIKALLVDTAKARFRGIPWAQLGSWGKRKFENLIVLKNSPDKVKIIYA